MDGFVFPFPPNPNTGFSASLFPPNGFPAELPGFCAAKKEGALFPPIAFPAGVASFPAKGLIGVSSFLAPKAKPAPPAKGFVFAGFSSF